MALIHFILNNWLELFGAISAMVYLYFSIKQNAWLWPLGIASSLVYLVVYFDARLYSEMGLQAYYVIISIYGWWLWVFAKHKTKGQLPIIRINMKQSLWLSLITILMFLAMGFLLDKYTDTDVPWADALATAFSITATYMLARKMLEQWLVWVLVDGYCIGLYIFKGLNITAFLFLVYSVMAMVGFLEWKKQYKAQSICL